MKAMPIEWHQGCLKNSMLYEEALKRQLAQMQADVDRLVKTNNFSRAQIEAAIAEGKDSFDRDSFFVDRKVGVADVRELRRGDDGGR